MARKTIGKMIAFSALIAQSIAGWSQGPAAVPQATPQQAIDFITSAVEQYSVFSCASLEGSPRDRERKSDTIKSLAAIEGRRLILQSETERSFSSTGFNRRTSERERNTVLLGDIEDITIEPGTVITSCKTPFSPVPAASIVRLRCTDSRKCVTREYEDKTEGDDAPAPNRFSQSESIAKLYLNDRGIAERVVKALNFYRQTVASAPSPF